MKKFCSSQVNVVTVSGGVGKWMTAFFFFRDNVNYQKYV